MWFYYSTAVARDIFGASSETDPIYTKGVEFAGLTLAFYNVVAFIFALIIPLIANKLGRKLTHSICLFCGAAGLIAVGYVTNKYMLYGCMVGVGIAWSSILSMPYAMLVTVCLKTRSAFIWVYLISLLFSLKLLLLYFSDG